MKQQKERVLRMAQQKWIIDKIIQVMGVESVLGWIRRLLFTAGLDLYTDVMDFRSRVRKYDDILQELLRIAVKRESMAKKAEDEGHLVTARDNYFSAAACYNFAQMVVHEDNIEDMNAYNDKKNECYDNFIKYAPHPVERVEIPFDDKSLPGFLHLPFLC